MRLPNHRSSRHRIYNLDSLMTNLRTRHNGFSTRQVVAGFEVAIDRLERAGLIVRQGGGYIKPTIGYLAQTADRIRRICLGQD